MLEIFFLLFPILPIAVLATGIFLVLKEASRPVAVAIPLFTAFALIALYIHYMPPHSEAILLLLNYLVGPAAYAFLIIAPFPLFRNHITFLRHEYVIFVTACITITILLATAPRTPVVLPLEQTFYDKFMEGSIWVLKTVVISAVSYLGLTLLDQSLVEGMENESDS
jgi:hypothetical protein